MSRKNFAALSVLSFVLGVSVADAQVPDAGAVIVEPYVGEPATDTSTAAAPAVEAKPSDKLPNPVDDPLAVIDTVKAQKKQGWAVTILACVVMLTMGLARAAQRWPSSRLFAWFAKNKTAIYLTTCAGTVGAAAFNALALGGTWMAAAYAAAGAFFTLVSPGTAKGQA